MYTIIYLILLMTFFLIYGRQNILDSQLMSKLKETLDEYNLFAKSFRMAKDRYDNFQIENLNL